jgi:hypothetical protein
LIIIYTIGFSKKNLRQFMSRGAFWGEHYKLVASILRLDRTESFILNIQPI